MSDINTTSPNVSPKGNARWQKIAGILVQRTGNVTDAAKKATVNSKPNLSGKMKVYQKDGVS